MGGKKKRPAARSSAKGTGKSGAGAKDSGHSSPSVDQAGRKSGSPLFRLYHLLCAAGSGALLSLSFPRWDFEGFVWFALAPLLAVLWFADPSVRPKIGPLKKFRATRGWRFFCLGWFAGFVFFCINLSWLLELEHIVGALGPAILGLVSLSAYLAIYFGLWGAFASTVGRVRVDKLFQEPASESRSWESGTSPVESAVPPSRWEGIVASSAESLRAAFLCASAWCGLEWLRGWLFTGFGWNGLGVALHRNVPMIQICDTIGVAGLSFLIIFCLCVGTATVRRLMVEVGQGRARPHLDFGVAIVIVICVFFYGMSKEAIVPAAGDGAAPDKTTTQLRVLMVQGLIPQEDKFDRDKAEGIYDLHLTFSTAASLYDLVVWPETALPFGHITPYNPHALNNRYLEPFLEGGDFNFLVGTNLVDITSGEEEVYNAAMLVKGDMRHPQFYRKIHLVPFGEYVPVKPIFGWVARWLPGGEFHSGKSTDPLTLDDPEVSISPLICFEDTVGRLARKVVRTGSPQLLVNVTNDGWFGHSSAPYQHMANAVFRCVELRRPMVRAANTGVTCAINEIGSLVDPTDPEHKRERIFADPDTGSVFHAGSFPATITMSNNPPVTFYARYGDAFSITLGAVALAAALVGLFRRRK